MSHIETNEYAAVAPILLDRGILQVDEADRSIEKRSELAGYRVCLPLVPRWERVVVESDPVDYGNEQKGPMCSALGFGDVSAVINREEDVSCAGEVGEGVAECTRIRGLEQQEGHAWTEEDDIGGFVSSEEFALKIFLPKGNYIICEPVVLERLHILSSQSNIVIAQVCIVGM